MEPKRRPESGQRGHVIARWERLDRGWQAVALGLAVVGLHWLLQTI
ncbi:hypothetical protein [Halalkalicoccus sp. NIPERK01]|nr:hypothetical protein [Halalkalicoccus sp. NIPERK01]MDL5362548.1 hypothetical protein [Halalkalicoccus sp. NIPERK01]